MSQEQSKNNIIDKLKKVQTAEYILAKRYADAFWIFQIILLCSAVVFAIYPLDILVCTITVFVATVLDALLSYKSDKHKSNAENDKRKYEFSDAFGILPSKLDLASLECDVSENTLSRVSNELLEGVAYYTMEQEGDKRALEALRESAWFSSKLANMCKNLLWVALLLTLGLAYIFVTYFVEYGESVATARMASKIVSVILLFIISKGLLSNLLGYCNFAKICENILSSAEKMLGQEKTERIYVIMLMSEYQLYRAQAPMIPTLLWEKKRKKLNGIWVNLYSAKK